MYKAILYFTDLQDDGHIYHAGDKFPRRGLKVSDERIAELLSDGNRRGRAVIAEVEKATPKKKGTKNA